MAGNMWNGNPLITTRPSDSNVTISLHPLVLLTVSDHVTRHRVRGETGTIVGALLGQQKGRETTVEHAFPCRAVTNNDGEVVMDQAWFDDRLQQHKDVHKLPTLELVGWFTLCPDDGPNMAVLPIQKQIMLNYNESAILLTFSPSGLSTDHGGPSNAKLPFQVYESTLESDIPKGDGTMPLETEQAMSIQFRAISYNIETDETEMIAIDYVAKGAGSAVKLDAEGDGDVSAIGSLRGNARPCKDEAEQERPIDETTLPIQLSVEQEDQIAGISTRVNSVRMLQSRLQLLSTFLQSQRPSYLQDRSILLTITSPDPSQLPHLREIQALLTRLSLLTPSIEPSSTTTSPAPDSFMSTSLSQSNDVALTSLLAMLGQDIQSMSEMGRKFAAIESGRNQRGRMSRAGPGGGLYGEFDVSTGGAGMMV